MKQPYTIEEILLLLEAARMLDVADRLRELWDEKNTTVPTGIPIEPYKQDTVGEVMALCERWRVAGGREEHHAYKEEIERVVEKLVSDRDVLMEALQSFRGVAYTKDRITLDAYIDAAIQKVST